jgi:hypothetical protein
MGGENNTRHYSQHIITLRKIGDSMFFIAVGYNIAIMIYD